MREAPEINYLHNEAFCLMEYHCKSCKNVEILWNSRDGVTPFIIDCPKCGMEAHHENWFKDRRSRTYHINGIKDGDRYFVDCSKEKFMKYKKKMIEEFWEGSPPMKDMFESKEEAMKYYEGEFEPGQPTIEVWGRNK